VQHFYGSSYRSLSQVAAAYAACEIVNRLIMEAQEHDESYSLLDRYLREIESAKLQEIPILLQKFIDTLLITLGFKRKDTGSTSLASALAAVERIIERKVRSVHLLLRSG